MDGGGELRRAVPFRDGWVGSWVAGKGGGHSEVKHNVDWRPVH